MQTGRHALDLGSTSLLAYRCNLQISRTVRSLEREQRTVSADLNTQLETVFISKIIFLILIVELQLIVFEYCNQKNRTR